MKKERSSAPVLGTCMLLCVFAVLCLTVFALLSLSTVLAEQRLLDASAEAVTAYYEAELAAQEQLARLRSGEKLPGVREQGNVVEYCIPISEQQSLQVAVDRRDWKILRWQTIAEPKPAEDHLPVWDGS